MATVTDQEVLSSIQGVVLEPDDAGATWPSGLWTVAEVLSYLNTRQDRLLATGLVGAWQAMPVVPQQTTQLLPEDWTKRIVHALLDMHGRTSPLVPLSRIEADSLLPFWGANGQRPVGYLSEARARGELVLVPRPIVPGRILLCYVAAGEPLDGTGRFLTLPDEWAPYLEFGALADMFGKHGRGFDAERRDWCEQRFAEGVALADSWVAAVTAA